MIISHESPLALLDKSLEYNDYEYILPFFHYRYPEYTAFNKKAKELGRFSILDNGLFEGETYTTYDLIKLIVEFKPNVFIAPDEWDDARGTHKHAMHWAQLFHYGEIENETELMIVLQGHTFSELTDLFDKCYDNGIRRFAINHSSNAFIHGEPYTGSIGINGHIMKMLGRVRFVNYFAQHLKNKGVTDVKVHLLGCNLPQEFIFYKGIDFIESCDTSNPIILGLENIIYGDFGQITKPKNKMEHYFEWPIANLGNDNEIGGLELNSVLRNIETFRNAIK